MGRGYCARNPNAGGRWVRPSHLEQPCLVFEDRTYTDRPKLLPTSLGQEVGNAERPGAERNNWFPRAFPSNPGAPFRLARSYSTSQCVPGRLTPNGSSAGSAIWLRPQRLEVGASWLFSTAGARIRDWVECYGVYWVLAVPSLASKKSETNDRFRAAFIRRPADPTARTGCLLSTHELDATGQRLTGKHCSLRDGVASVGNPKNNLFP